MPNRLAQSSSAYLRQHAENPVDWYPWGDEAFDRALAEDKPVIVSIGYSACHWCHVMAHESFENTAIAQLMNDQFVNIKVDREERPDVDSLYMDAVQSITGQGGWPLNVFLTPDRKPFYGGTYFPNAPRMGMPSWPQVLQSIALAWRDERTRVEASASGLLDHIAAMTQPPQPDSVLDPALLDTAAQQLTRFVDPVNGGFGSAPKFPNAMNLSYLLRMWARSGRDDYLNIVTLSLDQMAAGGIHDQLGGGFHRYTVDATWTVPHFEKMLYDNALLARLYTDAWRATKQAHYRAVAESTLDYLIRDMCSPEGGFYASEDADSEGAEGAFYVWTEADLVDLLDPTSRKLVEAVFGVTKEGNFEGKTILTDALSLSEAARRFGVPEDQAEPMLEAARATMLASRSGRVRPGRDEKLMTDWNSLAISALVHAGLAFSRKDYIQAATRCAHLIIRQMLDPEMGLRHTDSSGEGIGFGSDHAFFIEALLDLFEASGDADYLKTAIVVANQLVDQFRDADGSFAFTSHRTQELPLRPREFTDGVTPSATSSAASGLLRLSRYTDQSQWEVIAREAMDRLASLVPAQPTSFGYLLGAIDLHVSPRRELVVISTPDELGPLAQVAGEAYLPNLIRVVAAGPDASLPLLTGRQAVNGEETAYLCENYTCLQPITDADALSAELARLLPSLTPD